MGKSEHKRNVGILGGTFDPVHIGHLQLAEAACAQLNLDLVLFIPARKPPHKDRPNILDVELRYQMLKQAIAGFKYFKICRIEVEKPGVSYSVDTVRALRRSYKRAKFYFLVGSDAVLELGTWKDIDEILSLCVFVIAKRPGFSKYSLPKGTIALKGKFTNISSSKIRKMLKMGQDIKQLVPESVCKFIKEKKLYQ